MSARYRRSSIERERRMIGEPESVEEMCGSTLELLKLRNKTRKSKAQETQGTLKVQLRYPSYLDEGVIT